MSVCAANPAAGQWVGQPGVRCYDGALPVVSRFSPPNEGLLAADPADPGLLELLNGYESHCPMRPTSRCSQATGCAWASANAGYLLEDALGNRFHEGYRLHGVFDAETDEPAWTSKNGERLRGCSESAARRWSSSAGARSIIGSCATSACSPDLFLDRSCQCSSSIPCRISAITAVRKLALWQPYRSRWHELYPHHPIAKKTS